MNNLTHDTIAIDVNVLRHLTNPQNNVERHIDALLRQLIQDGIRLLVDDKKEITSEYECQIRKRAEDMAEERGQRLLLLYWLSVDNHETVTVAMTDELMSAITKIVPEEKEADRFYVYVAFKRERILVTNDKKDILNQRNLLAHICPQGADILDSQEAYDGL